MSGKLETLLACLPDAPFKEQLTEEIAKLQAAIPEWACYHCNTICLPPVGLNMTCPHCERGLLHPSTHTERKLREDFARHIEKAERDSYATQTGKAILRACELLPEGYDLHLECERGAATVRLYLADTDADTDADISDFGSDNTLAQEIDNAINIAIADSEKGGAA